MNDLTAIVVSFLRPEYSIDCIRSLRKHYPGINIILGEQSPTREVKKACVKIGAEYVELPFDCGVGKSRNLLIERAKTNYILVGDDDFLYDGEARVDKMLKFLKNTDFGLVAGRILENGNIKNYQGFIKIYKNYIRTIPYKGEPRRVSCGLRYKKCDLTFNYFVIRKSVAQKHPWNETIKVSYEHHHFFTNLKKAGVKVAYSPDPIVKHKFQKYKVPNKYKKFRSRREDKVRYLDSLGVDYTISINGKKVTR